MSLNIFSSCSFVLFLHKKLNNINHFLFNYLDKPEIIDKPSTLVNESEKVILTRTIVSNPLVDVQWYKGFKLLYSQLSVKNATYILEKASCTDTTNFTLVASNEVERNVTALVELLVNCEFYVT